MLEILDMSKSRADGLAQVNSRQDEVRVRLTEDLRAKASATDELLASNAAARAAMRNQIVGLESQIADRNKESAIQDAIIEREMKGMRDSERASRIGGAAGNFFGVGEIINAAAAGNSTTMLARSKPPKQRKRSWQRSWQHFGTT